MANGVVILLSQGKSTKELMEQSLSRVSEKTPNRLYNLSDYNEIT